MANLPSSFVYVNDVEVSQDAPVTEALNSKLGSNDNYLKDTTDTNSSDIADLQATDAEFQPKLYSRSYAFTSYGYSLSEPFSETNIATLTMTNVRANPDNNVLNEIQIWNETPISSASYSIIVGTGTVNYETKLRLTKQIGAGSETDLVNITKTGSASAHTVGTVSGDFLGAFEYLNKNIYVHEFSNSSDTTVTYRLYVDFNNTGGGGSLTSATFTASGLYMRGIQLR